MTKAEAQKLAKHKAAEMFGNRDGLERFFFATGYLMAIQDLKGFIK